jgi:FK506-binding protein 2
MKHPSSLGVLPAVVCLLATICSADDVKPAKAAAFNVEIVKAVECVRKSRAGDRLHVSYRGTLQKDGSEFDSSYGRQPIAFELGRGMVIKGWDAGLLAMCVGEKRKLTIPPDMGYGDVDMGKIPPNSVLRTTPLWFLSR